MRSNRFFECYTLRTNPVSTPLCLSKLPPCINTLLPNLLLRRHRGILDLRGWQALARLILCRKWIAATAFRKPAAKLLLPARLKPRIKNTLKLSNAPLCSKLQPLHTPSRSFVRPSGSFVVWIQGGLREGFEKEWRNRDLSTQGGGAKRHLLFGGRIYERRVSCTHFGSISVSGYPHVHRGIGRRLCEKRLDLWRLCHLRGRPSRLSGRGAAHQQAGVDGREGTRGAWPCVPRARAGAGPGRRDGEDRAARRAVGASLRCPARSCPRPGSSGSDRPRCGCSAPPRAAACTAYRRAH